MIREMGDPGNEIEVKLRFESAAAARQRLVASGMREHGSRHFEDNIIYERAVEPLKPAGKILRLRRVDELAWLTYKAPVPGKHRHKVREEHESAVADPEAIQRLLTGLGFMAHYRYQKYRTHFVAEGLLACLDETPLGCFVELEGRPQDIDRKAVELGFTEADYINKSYRELHEDAAGAAEPGDMVFDRDT